ncbi:MAG: NAD-dependent protein deacylase [Anaerolineaceae bacterium]|jgi:NAD-dependent deacetylase|nr:MAG: NAD-dependent protein deacylase [Anaerolineaceae bacterium]
MSQLDASHEILQAASLMAKNKRVIAFTGAGMSTRSGVPDFRSPGTGLWVHLEAAGTDETQSGTIQAFGRDPQTFYEHMKPLFQKILSAEPNAAHYALAELETRGIIHTVITQNADLLQQRAGSKNVIEVHGSLAEATCIQCYKVKPFPPLLDQFLSDGIMPRCQECGGAMKPNIILTGEQLPVRAMLAAQQALRRADILLIAGTSLAGGPATALVDRAYLQGSKLIIINQTPTLLDHVADVVVHDDVVKVLPAIKATLQKLKEGPHV